VDLFWLLLLEMIFQSLAVATAAGFLVAANATPKRADYYPISPVWGYPTISKIIDIRGFGYAIAIADDDEVGVYYANSRGVPFGFTDLVTDGGATYTTVASHDAVADFSVPSKAPPTFFAGLQNNLNAGLVTVHQGLKRTSLNAWSHTQTLIPPEQFSAHSFYGESMVVDQETHTLLAVGCPGCNATSQGGQVYLYSPNAGGAMWSQSQVLELSESATHAGYHMMGRDVRLHGDLLLASLYVPSTIPKNGYVVYSRGKGPKDSFEPRQIVSTKYGNVTAAAVYDDTIVLGHADASSSGYSNVGEVQILYPSSPERGLKPGAKPAPVQWSVQQVLHPPTKADDVSFGTSVAIDNNLLVVSSLDSKKSYLFERQEKSGKWSQQQVLTSAADATFVSIAGSAIALSSLTHSGISTIYTNKGNWDCLIISLEDHFGDGWDTAELIVATPDGTHDYFAQDCPLSNPLKLRYCPSRSDGGLYSFSIPQANKAKHYWEIQWSVFDEKTGVWYRGKWDTKMDFHWDPDTLNFSPRKIERALANSTVCEYCPSRPTDKPTPLLGRHLKGGTTRSPTISPAPTLSTTNSENWRYLTLYGDSHSWFDNQYQGTNYYVSDARGHRLINTGTACTTGIDQKCWLDLPDGDYILRVGGALDPHKSSHKFTFCKNVITKSTRQEMVFRIRDDDCTILTFASRSTICKNLGYMSFATFYVVLNVNMLLHGTSISTATSAEHTVFEAAVASIFKGLTPSDVSLVSVSPTGSNTVVNANIRMSSAIGYNLLNYDEEIAFEAFLKDSFSSQVMESNLVVGLSSGSLASAFARVSRVEFLDYQIVDTEEVLDISEVPDMVTSFADLPTSSYVETAPTESSAATSALLLDSTYIGYFLASIGILFAVAVVASARKKQTHSLTDAPLAETAQIPSNQNVFSAKTLTPADLQELSHMQQEYLKIATHNVPS
jgi:hypothetical protein